jgi:hypothetical protein
MSRKVPDGTWSELTKYFENALRADFLTSVRLTSPGKCPNGDAWAAGVFGGVSE